MQRALWFICLVTLAIALSAALPQAADTPPELALTLEQHRFTPTELRVGANAPFVLVITNKDAEEEEFEISSLRIENIIPGGKTLRLRMPALKPGIYEFVGEFHEDTAKGRILAE